jgi:hypothetical protein
MVMRRFAAAALAVGLVVMMTSPVLADIAGIGDGSLWASNGSATFNVDDLTIPVGSVRMTEAVNGQTSSVWYNETGNDKQGVEVWSAQFDYQMLAGNDSPADGACFVLQNGLSTAMGGGGGSRGYIGMPASAALMLDIYSGGPTGRGYELGLNGQYALGGGGGGIGGAVPTTPVNIVQESAPRTFMTRSSPTSIWSRASAPRRPG